MRGDLIRGEVWAVIALCILTAGQALADSQFVRARKPAVLSQAARTFLESRDRDTLSIWVFFTDKGFADARGFASAAASVNLTERALKRRSKVGKDHVVFADLPVATSYITQITSLGGIHRRSSRWLNAASFDLPADRLDAVAALPFVGEMTPVAYFRVPEVTASDAKEGPADLSQSAQALDYGFALGQMSQINVVSAHQKGYTGAGVTLTIMDTGFRKSHNAFQSHFADNRVLAEYDFVHNDGETANQADDASTQWSHGTLIWSVSGGYAPGQMIGPAYHSNFILCKTETISSETPAEEDNWVAALEWADSIGTDVITSSLAYSDWYTYADFDGRTAVITLAANRCDSLGIVLCNAMGNEGPSAGTLDAPADAFDILSVGAVDNTGSIAGFSSRGPTYDGRLKPEVCAQGVSTYSASSTGDAFYTRADGTSLSTPLIAGAACVLIEARPDFTPAMIREAVKATADNADDPDNIYGWGIINMDLALQWPIRFTASNTTGAAPLAVSFADESWLEAVDRTWEFGDGSISTEADPVHEYTEAGAYPVTLTIVTEFGDFTKTIPGIVLVQADSLRVDSLWAETSYSNRVDVFARNFIPIDGMEIPFTWDGSLEVRYDSFSTAGLRTADLGQKTLESYDLSHKRAAVYLGKTGLQDPLPPGDGPVVSLYFTVIDPIPNGLTPIKLISFGNYTPHFVSGAYSYQPTTLDGALSRICCNGRVGDADASGDDEPTLGDLSQIIDCLFISLNPLECYAEADVNQSGGIDAGRDDLTLGDISLLIDYLFINHTPLSPCLSE